MSDNNNNEIFAMLGIDTASVGSKNTESLSLKEGQETKLVFTKAHWGPAGAYRQDDWSIPSSSKWSIPGEKTIMVVEDTNSNENVLITQAVMNSIAALLLEYGANFTKNEEVVIPEKFKSKAFGYFTADEPITVRVQRQAGDRGKYVVVNSQAEVGSQV